MTIRYSKKFVKQLSKQPVKIQRAVYSRLLLFEENPYAPHLRNHVLSGKFQGMHSINITGDIRAIYEVFEDEIYLYQMIGTHSQLYK